MVLFFALPADCSIDTATPAAPTPTSPSPSPTHGAPPPPFMDPKYRQRRNVGRPCR